MKVKKKNHNFVNLILKIVYVCIQPPPPKKKKK